MLGARVEALEASRAESDELINTLSAEEFSKFAASDVADALKFVAGVNVVEGQFAIIRGLEDRYSSTLYNSAPIPSPDPDKQSVQLDLFASDIVSNLVVAKTFGADLPSNSSAGSINILTHDYPEEIEVKVQAGSRLQRERHPELPRASTRARRWAPRRDGCDTIESDFAGALGGRAKLLGREFRFKGVGGSRDRLRDGGGLPGGKPAESGPNSIDEVVTRSGGLAFGAAGSDDGALRPDHRANDRSSSPAMAGSGIDLDEGGDHRLDGSIFYTKKKNEAVDLRENGYLPGFDYGPAIAEQQASWPDRHRTLFTARRSSCVEVCASLDAWIARIGAPGRAQQPSMPRARRPLVLELLPQPLVRHRTRPDRLPAQRRPPHSMRSTGST